MQEMKRLAIEAGVYLAVAAPAQAQGITAAEALEIIDNGRLTLQTPVFLLAAGIENGLFAANQYLRARLNLAPLYCQPQEIVLTPEQTFEILRAYMAVDSQAGQRELPSAIISSLRHRFPCER